MKQTWDSATIDSMIERIEQLETKLEEADQMQEDFNDAINLLNFSVQDSCPLSMTRSESEGQY